MDAATKIKKPSAKKEAINKEAIFVFQDKDGVVKDYFKAFLGENKQGRLGDRSGKTGKVTKLLGRSIGSRRLIYLALWSLETMIDNGELDRDGIVDILAKSKVSIF